MSKKNLLSFFLILSLFSSCSPKREVFEPEVSYTPVVRDIALIPSAFPPLREEEKEEAWGEELYVGRSFAKELDLYRAITSFKKALFLIPRRNIDRILEIEYCIIHSYFLAGRYIECANAFEVSHLKEATSTNFPAFRDLIIILWETYRNTGECDKAEKIFQMIEKNDPELADQLSLYLSLKEGNIFKAQTLATGSQSENAVNNFRESFCMRAKSPKTAEFLNAFLPGAGYWYIGQKRSAITSFVINALFGWATYRFFEKGYPAAGLITLSLETGWYFGGINGAALEAKYYNERLYQQSVESMMTDRRLFPALMLDFSF